MNPLHNFYKVSVSNIFIWISIFFTLIAVFIPELEVYKNWGMHSFFLLEWNYLHFLWQIFSSQFIHGWFLHLLMNIIFIYYFGNIVELMLWAKKYVVFFCSIAAINAAWLYFFEPFAVTVWISGFALALLTYYTLELWSQKNPEYQGWITAIVINIAIGFYPWISLYWHLFWVIWWAIFYIINRKIIGLYVKKLFHK